METQSLEGTWKLSGAGKIGTAQIPGDFHTALLNAGLIPDPYYAMNESDVQWVGKTDWTIERTFEFHRTGRKRTFLSLSDADTFFTIYINGTKAGSGENMFCRYHFDVTELLTDGINTIRIVFASAENHAVRTGEELPYPIPYSIYPVYSPHRNLVRKVQCHAGWDWGPCLMVSGIYGKIRLLTTAYGWFENVTVQYRHKKGSGSDDDIWNADIQAEYVSLCNENLPFDFRIDDTTRSLCEKSATYGIKTGQNTLRTNLEVCNPELWHSADELKDCGLTENHLYNLSVRTTRNQDNTDTADIIKKIGFRTLCVVTENDKINADGKEGKSMTFELNNRPVFAKGADWIPCDALPSRQTEKKYTQLLTAAAGVNMNMLRVWGGGQYEKDIFYDLCDKLGIMIWQDCMFACSLYPSTPDFLKNVTRELDYQIPRLQSHPCIALWCGNNEDIGAINWYEESRKNRDRYIIDYDRLNSGVVEKAVKKWDPGRSWWPSSPSAGPDDYSDNWHNDSRGDMHFWNVWHEKSSFSAYLSIMPRFVSEFGYESFPGAECITHYVPRDEWNMTSPVMEYHQRSAEGNSTILENFSRYFRFPDGFRNMIYLSQVQQALAIKTAVEYWRTLRPYCMGSIFWQLNDVWPAVSWSSIDYTGKWKLLQYAAKDFYAPVMLSLYSKDGEYVATVCNDTGHTLNTDISIHILHFDGTPAEQPVTLHERIQSDCACAVWKEKTETLKEKKEKCFIYAELTAASCDGHTYTSENTLFPALYKQSLLEQPQITKTVEAVSEMAFAVTLESVKPAFFTTVDCAGIQGNFNRNLVTLLPGRKKTLIFTADNKTDLLELKKAISVISLRDTY